MHAEVTSHTLLALQFYQTEVQERGKIITLYLNLKLYYQVLLVCLVWGSDS